MKTILYATMMAMLLLMPDTGAAAAADALAVWGLDVAPSLFPYMVLCQSLSSVCAGKAGLGRWLPFFLGLLGGSPSASASLCAVAQAGPLSRRALLLLVSLAGTVSPMFFLGSAAKWLASADTARRLLFAQYAGALLCGGTLYLLSGHAPMRPTPHASRQNSSPDNPITRSVHAILNVGGCIIFYSTAAACFGALLPSFAWPVREVVHAALEVSGGLRALSLAPLNQSVREVLAAGLCGFGGLSILSQNLFFLQRIGLSMKELSAIALLRGLFSSLFMGMLLIM